MEEIKIIEEKIYSGERITPEEGLLLYNQELGFLGVLANHIREKKQGNNTYYIKNFHIEPSNICVYNCRFCSYSSRYSGIGWDDNIDEIIDKISKKYNNQIKEIHITGSANPRRNVDYYIELISKVRKLYPNVNIKAFSAVEIHYISEKSGMDYEELLKLLKEAGLDSLPGGGSEIFDEKIRAEICPDKVDSENWLKIHETAHKLGISTNATMLYSHIEKYWHRVEHMNRLRKLQDKTNGFGAFIPLKYKNFKNDMSYIKEGTQIEDLKNYAVSRIFLDNFPHIKAYWPMLGKELTQLSLSFGVDDIDGTIEDSTKIYSLAGSEDKNPTMNEEEMKNLISGAKRIAVER